MKVRGLRSFCGTLNMRKNQIKDVDEKTAERLVKVGYVEYVEKPQEAEKKTAKKASSKKKAEAENG